MASDGNVLSLQSCLTLCQPMDCNPPGSSVLEILQARILQWVAISYSRGKVLSLAQNSKNFLHS